MVRTFVCDKILDSTKKAIQEHCIAYMHLASPKFQPAGILAGQIVLLIAFKTDNYSKGLYTRGCHFGMRLVSPIKIYFSQLLTQLSLTFHCLASW